MACLISSGNSLDHKLPLIVTLLTALVMLGHHECRGQNSQQTRFAGYKLLRSEEDYAFLKDHTNPKTNLFDPVKFIPLNSTKTAYLSAGGEIRYQYEYINNNNWGEGPKDNNGHLLQRYMLHTDWHLSKHIRVFGQLKSGIETGRAGGPDLPDEDKLDLHQAFVDLNFNLRNTSFTVRAGRQEMTYGSSRLVSVREGPNVRQSFDAGKIKFRLEKWQSDVFLSRPAETNTGIFDDRTNPDIWFWGWYNTASFTNFLKGNLDFYYFGFEEKEAEFSQGTAREERHSLGLRFWGNESRLRYNLESVYQFGTYGHGKISAWTASSELSYSLGKLLFKPVLNLKTEIISGDRSSKAEDLQTFNPLFPKGAYFGQVALIGPANLIDLHPSLTLNLTKDLDLITDWDFFWRESTEDGLYGVPYVLIREHKGSSSTYIGDQLTFELDWEATRHLQLEGFCTYFRAGDFLKETGSGKNLAYLSGRITFKF